VTDGCTYTGKTGNLLEVPTKEHKYNLMQGLVKKSKLAQHAYKEGKVSAHVSGSSLDQSTKLGCCSHLVSDNLRANQQIETPTSLRSYGNVLCYLGVSLI
jgi:hypothetical protein